MRKSLAKGIGICGTEVCTGDVIVECRLLKPQQRDDM